MHHDKLPGSDIPTEASESVRSRQACMTARDAGVADNKGPRHWDNEAHRRNVREELARGGWSHIDVPPDSDTSVYYYLNLLMTNPETGETMRLPVLPVEGAVLPFLLGYAIGLGRWDVVEQLNYRQGMLPVGPDPLRARPRRTRAARKEGEQE